jgi:acetyltransferase
VSLEALFSPRGVAVIGASADPDKLGGAMAASLAPYDGNVALVNPRGGDQMFTSVTEAAAAGPIDLAVLCIPAPACAAVLDECGAAGIGAALICAGGFAEAGGEGVGHQDDVLDAARRHDIRLLGPNTSGFFVPRAALLASFVPGVASLSPGGVGLVAASGGLNHALAFAFDRELAGLSVGVGIGAGIDVAAPDVLDHLAADDATTVIALHLETISDGPALIAAVRRAAAIKPVVALVIGKNDIGEFAQSHTGALATSWRTTRALLEQAGAVVVESVDALVTAATVLSRARIAPTASPAAALVTAQAGPGLAIVDAAQDTGVGFPRLTEPTIETLSTLLPPMTYQANPVDTGRPGPRHSAVISTVADDPEIDVTAVYALAEPVVDLVEAATSAHRNGAAIVLGVDGPADDVAKARHRAADAGIPLVVGPQAVAVALDALARDATLRDLLADTSAPAGIASASGPTVDLPATGLTESAAKDLLERCGITTPARRVVTDLAQAQAARSGMAGPVAVKISSADVLHKSDIGGVRLGVATPEAMAEAFGDVRDAARRAGVGEEILIEEMAPAGTDLIVSARRDPVFGVIVVVGVGGTATEVYADVAVAAWPATRGWLTHLPDRLVARGILDGHRGGVPVDRDQLTDVLDTLGRLVHAHPSISDVEINPLRATADGLIALDAVVLTDTLATKER